MGGSCRLTVTVRSVQFGFLKFGKVVGDGRFGVWFFCFLSRKHTATGSKLGKVVRYRDVFVWFAVS